MLETVIVTWSYNRYGLRNVVATLTFNLVTNSDQPDMNYRSSITLINSGLRHVGTK